MKYASDFRAIARDALRGKWMIAVIVGLVASLLGGGGSDGPQVKLNISETGANLDFAFAGQTVYSTGGGLHSGIGAFLVGSAVYIALAAIVIAVIYFVLEVSFRSAMPDLTWSWWTATTLPLTPCLHTSPTGKRRQWPGFCKACMFFFGHCCLSFQELLPVTVMR